jgi:hypothetical protein
MDKLAAKGFDTEKKVMSLEMEIVHENGLDDEIGGTLDLKKAIRQHRLYAYLYNGKDPVPAKKEVKPDVRNESEYD